MDRVELARIVYEKTRRLPTYGENYYDKPEIRERDEFGSYGRAIESGRNYLVGRDMPIAEFIKTHTSSLRSWMKAVCEYCAEHPEDAVYLETPGRSWVFRKRGEYVDIGLPHHDSGGERNWITLNCRSRVLVNVD